MSSSLVAGTKSVIPFSIGQTDLLAGTSFFIAAPFDGWIEELGVVVQSAVTTGGAVTVEVATVAVAGLSVTVADAAAAGTIYTDTPTAKSGTREVSKGDLIEIVPAAAFATAGAINGYLTLNSANTDPAL